MFIVRVNYTSGLDEIDALLERHIAYLNEYYAKGNFLLSGRQEPRTGGVIIARASSREELQTILAQDPFHQAGVAEYLVTEFSPTLAAAGLEHLTEG